jgi:DNA-binding NarL/FixJ family response regulator
MAGGTLVVSREVNNHLYYKDHLVAIGFDDVRFTALEKDALNFLIREIKPKLLIMDARFYQGCTPFLMGELRKIFPKIKMAALCIGEYPAETAMYFILNGVSSYLSSFDGFEQFFNGLKEICKGGECVSPEVLERIYLRKGTYPMPAGKISDRHKEVIRLICCGWKDSDIADVLHISRRTVDNHKTDIFTSLNVNSSNELIRAALTLEITTLEEIHFCPKGYTVNPKPKNKNNKEEKDL